MYSVALGASAVAMGVRIGLLVFFGGGRRYANQGRQIKAIR